MDWVTEHLAIGSYRTTRDFERLKQEGVQAVLYLFEDRDEWPIECDVMHLPIPDGERLDCGLIQKGTGFVRQHIVQGHKAMAVCGHGVSRSSTFILACLVEDGYSLQDAHSLLRLKHPQALPHPALWKSLIDCYNLPYTIEECLRWK